MNNNSSGIYLNPDTAMSPQSPESTPYTAERPGFNSEGFENRNTSLWQQSFHGEASQKNGIEHSVTGNQSGNGEVHINLQPNSPRADLDGHHSPYVVISMDSLPGSYGDDGEGNDDDQRHYEGYEAKGAAVFSQALPSVMSLQGVPIRTISYTKADIDNRMTRTPALVFGAFCIIGFVVCMTLGFSDVSYSVSLCDKNDGSYISFFAYVFELLGLSAPLPAISVTSGVAFLSGSLLCLVLRMVCASSAGYLTTAMMTFYAHIRKIVKSLRQSSALTVYIALVFPLFIVIGLAVRLSTAGAFIVGTLLGIAAVLLSMSVSTRVVPRVAQFAKKGSRSILSGFALLSRKSSVVPQASHTFSFGALVRAYLLIGDVNALVGLALGGANIALGLHAIAGTLAASSWNSRQVSWFHADDARSTQATVPSTGAISAGIEAYESKLCVVFAWLIVAAAILGAIMNYFENNPHAKRVCNHLAIGQTVILYFQEIGKQSFAVGLYRMGDFFSIFRKLESSQLNNLYVLLPFISSALVIVSIGISAIVGRRKPRDSRERLGAGVRTEVKPGLLQTFFSITSVGQLVYIIVATILYLAILIFVVGPRSEFVRTNSKVIDRYLLPQPGPPSVYNQSAVIRERCRTSSNETLPGSVYPSLGNVTTEQYGPGSSFGRKMPRANLIAWYIFGCLEIGLICGFFLFSVTAHQSSPLAESAKWAHMVAADQIDRKVDLSTGGGAIGGLLSVLIVTDVLCFCNTLVDAYGVAQGEIGVLSSFRPISMLCTIEQMSKDVRRVGTSVGVSLHARRRAALLAAAEETITSWGKWGITATAKMGAMAFVWVLGVQTKMMPSPVQLVGVSGTLTPTRHIPNVKTIDLVGVHTLGAMFVGFVLPVFLELASRQLRVRL